jgi:tRNA(Ile2) C34 agmatinyltransferase TiaS
MTETSERGVAWLPTYEVCPECGAKAGQPGPRRCERCRRTVPVHGSIGEGGVVTKPLREEWIEAPPKDRHLTDL